MKENKKTIKIYTVPIIIIGLLTALDQLTKFMITSSFELYESRPVIKNVLSFTYIQNRGVAWGMFQGKRVIFLILTAIILLLCFYIYSNIANNPKYCILRANMIILMSGALGNMIDRIKLGYVVDFFEAKFIDFPIFNVADIYVVVSMIMIFILIIFKYSNEEFDEIIGSKKDKEQD
ncbi:MAG: signal peptidase II [Lachnospiraceae bacterium]|nr:signal peptidase II [Lachnospiraceae bacterium]